MDPWKMWKQGFDAWENATATYLEQVLRSPLLLGPSGAMLSAAMKARSKVNDQLAGMWGGLGLPTKRDQERELHALLLFAIGALVAIPGANLNLSLMFLLLTGAAILGDAINYAAGRYAGPRLFRSSSSRLLNRNHLLKAQEFYERYGGKAIFLARFVPIIRTFAPFVAGIGRMNTFRFWTWNVSGAVCWVGLILFVGYSFGNVPMIKRNFTLVIFGIIGVSVLPILIGWYRARKGVGSAGTATSQSIPSSDRPSGSTDTKPENQ